MIVNTADILPPLQTGCRCTMLPAITVTLILCPKEMNKTLFKKLFHALY